MIRTPNDPEEESSDSYNGASAGFNCQNRQPAARNPPNVRCSMRKIPDELLRILPVAREAQTLYFHL